MKTILVLEDEPEVTEFVRDVIEDRSVQSELLGSSGSIAIG